MLLLLLVLVVVVVVVGYRRENSKTTNSFSFFNSIHFSLASFFPLYAFSCNIIIIELNFENFFFFEREWLYQHNNVCVCVFVCYGWLENVVWLLAVKLKAEIFFLAILNPQNAFMLNEWWWSWTQKHTRGENRQWKTLMRKKGGEKTNFFLSMQ